MQWTQEQKENLMKIVRSYRPRCEEAPHARVLLLGPVGSGKSSFISSVQSVFNGRVTNRAMVGSFSTSFTKKLRSFNIHDERGEENSGLVLCDIVGLGDGEMTGLTLHDVLSVIKGHAPEGHKFSPEQPVRSETVGYVKLPNLKDKIHCVAFVVDASKITVYPKSLSATFKKLREHISELGVHQVALLTHIDQICPETNKDVTQVYKRQSIKDALSKAGALLGMSTSYIVPVKNYSSELDLDVNTDMLLLSAVDHILQYTDLFFQDHKPRHIVPKILKLLYQASVHGFTAAAFHQRCDNVAPTVSVGYNASGYVFGGYTRRPFCQSEHSTPSAPLHSEAHGYRKSPGLEEQIHCVVYVIDACKISIMPSNLEEKLDATQKVNLMGIPQLVLLTKVDEACFGEEDLRNVYKSGYIKDLVQEVSFRLGVPLYCILPVKNYSEELELDMNCDILLLSAIIQMLRCVDDYTDELSDRLSCLKMNN
ncbi:LOW QUALITY PROTEIN: interferon-induced protein 44 [Xenentodon cancila]